jgi:type I restriction enzyme S subunit
MSLLPPGWESCSIGEVTQVVAGGTPPSTDPANFQQTGGVPWLTPADLSGYRDMYISRGARNLSEAGYNISSAKKMPAGAVLFSSRAPIGYVAIAKSEISTNQGFKSFVLPDMLDSRYVYYYLRHITPLAESLATGTTFKELSGASVAKLPLLIAPLPEQKRIADKLDTVLARVDACRERLDRVALILKRFRQSVLAAATSGELTADWKNKGTKKWRVLRADEVCAKVQSGGTPKSGFIAQAGIPFLKVYNIVNQKIDFEYRPQFVSEIIHGRELAKSRALPGDVLMNIVGPPLGKVAIVPHTYSEWNINQAITLFRPSSEITSEWLYILLCDGKNVRNVLTETKGSVGQVNISLSQCRAFTFSVPARDEQQELMRRVQTLFAFADRLEARLTTARTAADRLTPALLAKAFRGELVPQDPEDEPAAALLARLAASRAADGAKAGRSGKPAKRKAS